MRVFDMLHSLDPLCAVGNVPVFTAEGSIANDMTVLSIAMLDQRR